jgi:hypothetical protein
MVYTCELESILYTSLHLRGASSEVSLELESLDMISMDKTF